MNAAEPVRSSEARAAAELALVRVVHHYGEKPGFVLLGGLVPPLLCSNSEFRHAGTTDVDVQVDLEIARGATVAFDNCRQLGAVNLRGTGYAARDIQEQTLQARDSGILREVQVNVSGLGGFLMAKAAAANGRNKPKDWYDIAYVLLHNDDGPSAGAAAVTKAFGSVAVIARTWLLELHANFGDPNSQGTIAYVKQFLLDHPNHDPQELGADAMLAVDDFCARLLS